MLSVAGAAHADGDDRALSLGLGFADFSEPGPAGQQPATITPSGGATLWLSYEHAFASEFSLRGDLAGAWFYGGQNADPKNTSKVSWAGLADVGITFRFDVLKWVPYAFGGIGVMGSTGGAFDNGVVPVLVLGGGVDILVSRAWSWGIEGRLVGFATDTTVFTIGLRGTRRWGFL